MTSSNNNSQPTHPFAYQVATVLGVGKMPYAPGTWGSLVALPIGYLFLLLPPAFLAFAIILLTWLGAWASARHFEQTGQHDAGEIVVDEVVGQWICMYPLLFLSFTADIFLDIALSFILFRLFDIMKPWPIKVLDQHIKSGWGVMIDDIAAGVMGGLCLIAMDKYF